MDFFKDLFVGFIHPKEYGELLSKGKSRVVVYALILIAVSSIIIITSLNNTYTMMGKYYKEVVPEFSFSNNELTMSEPFNLELFGTIISADSDKQFTKQDFGNNIQGILFDKDSCISKTVGQVIEVKYSDLTDNTNTSFTKNDTFALFPYVNTFFYIFMLITLIFNICGFFICVLIVALFALIPNKVTKLKFGTLFKAAIFSRGLPQILSLILSAFIGPIPFLLNILLSFILVNIALQSIATKNNDSI